MSCQECRGYSVPYCPICFSGQDHVSELPGYFELVDEILAAIKNGHYTTESDVFDKIARFAKENASCQEDDDAIYGAISDEITSSETYQNADLLDA